MIISTIVRIMSSMFIKNEPLLPTWYNISTAIAPKIDAIVIKA